jgi:hypothetical protein
MTLLLTIKFIGAVLAVGAAAYSLSAHNAPPRRKRVILFLWTLLPPVFFFFEYFFQAPHLQPDELTRFKDLQGHASKIWAALVAILTIAYVKPKSDEKP